MPSHNTKILDSSYRGTKKPRTCVVCGTQFISYQAIPSKYCGYICLNSATKTKVVRKCRTCGNEFDFAPSQLKAYSGAGKYCSRECSYKGIVKETATKPTKDKWQRTSRKADKEWQLAVRQKDNYTCRRCGVFQLYIHTHHVATRSTRPDLKHVVANGICLCNSCHSWVHHHPEESYKSGWLSREKYEAKSLSG